MGGFRVQWTETHVLRLLRLIEKVPGWRYAIFTKSGARPKDMWTVYRDINVAYFHEVERWQVEMQVEGLVKRQNGRWVPTPKWDSSIYNPIAGKLIVLKDEAKKDDVGIKNKIHPSWTSEADLPLQTREWFKKANPYYFLLRRLCSEEPRNANPPVLADIWDTLFATSIPVQMQAGPSEPPNKRRKPGKAPQLVLLPTSHAGPSTWQTDRPNPRAPVRTAKPTPKPISGVEELHWASGDSCHPPPSPPTTGSGSSSEEDSEAEPELIDVTDLDKSFEREVIDMTNDSEDETTQHVVASSVSTPRAAIATTPTSVTRTTVWATPSDAVDRPTLSSRLSQVDHLLFKSRKGLFDPDWLEGFDKEQYHRYRGDKRIRRDILDEARIKSFLAAYEWALKDLLTVNVLYGVGVYVEKDLERHNRDYCHMKDRTMRLMKQVGARICESRDDMAGNVTIQFKFIVNDLTRQSDRGNGVDLGSAKRRTVLWLLEMLDRRCATRAAA